MPKRKREEEASPETHATEDDRALRIRKSRLIAQTEQGNILLHRALKVARGFERQKLGRRQKAAKENAVELLRLKEEVIVLKQLDLAKTAENYLFKQLVRTKRIREAPVFVGRYGKDGEGKVQGVKARPEANVVGRLVNSNPVREVFPKIMSKIYGCLGLKELSASTKAKGETGKTPAIDPAEVESVKSDGDERWINSGRRLSVISDEYKSEGSTEVNRFAAGNSDTKDDEGLINHARHRLASSSPSKSGSDTEKDDPFRRTTLHQNHRLQYHETVSPSPCSSSTPSHSPSPPRLKPTNTPWTTSSTATLKPKPAHTTFLPSLTLGGYFSGSDSDSDSGSDTNPNLTNPRYPRTSSARSGSVLPQPRKNRRGQHARQQIAEKKYGGGAKHLRKKQQLQVEGTAGRDSGWDGRKGAIDASAAVKRKFQGKDKRFAGKGKWEPTGANSDAVTTMRSNRVGSQKKMSGSANQNGNEGPIHPSWEAARKRKLQGQKVMGTFQGTKITFE